jgi:hypothetical protein
MSALPPKADIVTAGIYDTRPSTRRTRGLSTRRHQRTTDPRSGRRAHSESRRAWLQAMCEMNAAVKNVARQRGTKPLRCRWPGRC